MSYPTKKLGEIAKTTSGGTPLRSTSIFWGGNIPWLKSGELNDNLYIDKSEEFITETGLNNSSAKLFKKGTLLIALYGATAGKLGILDFDSTTNQAVCSIQNIYGLFDEKYIFYFLFTKRKQIIKDSFGGAQPNISKGYLDNLSIPLPPLPTQKLIVQKLDSSFEKIDKSIELTKKNLENIEELNKSVLEEVFSENGYKVKKLKDVVTLIMGQSPKSETYNRKGIGLPFFQGKKEFGEVNPVAEVYCSSPIKIAENGDILMSVRAPVGPTNIANQKCCIGRGLGAIRPNLDILELSYLLSYFKKFESEISSLGKGSTFSSITKSNLENLQIPLPPLEKQKEIVAQLDKVFEKNKALKESYEKKLKDLEEMKQSLLKEAFEGRLVKE